MTHNAPKHSLTSSYLIGMLSIAPHYPSTLCQGAHVPCMCGLSFGIAIGAPPCSWYEFGSSNQGAGGHVAGCPLGGQEHERWLPPHMGLLWWGPGTQTGGLLLLVFGAPIECVHGAWHLGTVPGYPCAMHCPLQLQFVHPLAVGAGLLRGAAGARARLAGWAPPSQGALG